MIKIKCANCGKTYEVSEEFIGKIATCKQCGNKCEIKAPEVIEVIKQETIKNKVRKLKSVRQFSFYLIISFGFLIYVLYNFYKIFTLIKDGSGNVFEMVGVNILIDKIILSTVVIGIFILAHFLLCIKEGIDDLRQQ